MRQFIYGVALGLSIMGATATANHDLSMERGTAGDLERYNQQQRFDRLEEKQRESERRQQYPYSPC